MKNITKILLTIFASVAITTASFAGALNVTGDAKASYNIQSADGSDNNNGDKGKALGITNEITFSATGELDNGWAWKYQTELDSGAETTSGAGIDDSQIVFTTDYGTVGLMVSDVAACSLSLSWTAKVVRQFFLIVITEICVVVDVMSSAFGRLSV